MKKKKDKDVIIKLPIVNSVRVVDKNLKKEKGKDRLAIKKDEGLFVVDKTDNDFLCVNSKGKIGYVKKENCIVNIRKVKNRVEIKEENFMKFLKKYKQYDAFQKKSATKIKRWFRKYKYRKKLVKKLEGFGERMYAKNEIVENDKSYVTFLQTIKDLYYEPFKTVLTVKQHDGLFGNFLEVQKVANEMHDAIMKYYNKNKSPFLGIADHLNKLKASKEYIANIPDAMNLWRSLNKEHEKTPNAPKSQLFLKLKKEAKENPRSCGLNIENLAIKPFQRMFTFKNVLGTVLKKTPQDSYLYLKLKKLEEDLTNLCSEVDSHKKNKEAKEKLEQIGLKKKGRSIKKEKKIQIAIVAKNANLDENIKFKEVDCMLCTDILYYKGEKDKRGKVLYFILMTEAKEYDGRNKKLAKAIIINSIETKIILKIKRKADRNQWFKSLKDGIRKYAILSKRRHGVENMEEFAKTFCDTKTEIYNKYEKEIKEYKNEISKMQSKISQKIKNNTYQNLLIRNNLGAIVKNFGEILESKQEINKIGQKENEIKMKKKENILKSLDHFSKIKECMDYDLHAFKQFQKDYSYFCQELERLKKKTPEVSTDTDTTTLEFHKGLLDSKNSLIEILKEGKEEIKNKDLKIKKLNEKASILREIEENIETQKKKEFKKQSFEYLKKLNGDLKKKDDGYAEKIVQLKEILDSLKEKTKKQIDQLEKKNESLKKTEKENKVKLTSYENGVKDLETRLSNKEKEFDELKENFDQLNSEKKGLDEKYKVAQNRIKALQKQLNESSFSKF